MRRKRKKNPAGEIVTFLFGASAFIGIVYALKQLGGGSSSK